MVAREEENRMRFRKWLRAQTERTDGVGQLARDVDNWKYTYFPNAQTERAVVNYLKSIGAADETIAAGKQAIYEWHNQMSGDTQPVTKPTEGRNMVTEGSRRQRLRKLVDHLPDELLDVATVFLSNLTSAAPPFGHELLHYGPPSQPNPPTEVTSDAPQLIDDYHDEDEEDEYIEACKWCGDEFKYLEYGDTCNSCRKLGRD